MAGLVVKHRNEVGWLIFDRPRAGNAMDAAMLDALPVVWRELDADPRVRAIVVTGRGRAFQTGLDMGALAGDPASLRAMSRRTKNADLQLTGWHLGVTTPVITAVNGVCAGGGLHFVVDADIVIASTAASFLDPHVSVGQCSTWESIGLSHRIPAGIAARLVLTGRHERLDVERARQLGLVSEVVEPDALIERAQQIGETLAAADGAALRAVKRALWVGAEVGLGAARRSAAAAAGREPAEGRAGNGA